MLDDETFLRITRRQVNPAEFLADRAVAALASGSEDMPDNYPILYAIARAMPGASGLEIGVHDGTSTLALLKGVSERGSDQSPGHLTSIDEVSVPCAEALVDRFGLRPWWTLRKGNSHTLLKEMISGGMRASFDFAFVDGDHSYEGAKADIEDVAQLLKPEGVLLTHDNCMVVIDVDESQPFGSRAKKGCGLFAETMVAGGTEWSGMYFPFNCNLGVWRRRDAMLRAIGQSVDENRALGRLP